jgi:hypothetical protein
MTGDQQQIIRDRDNEIQNIVAKVELTQEAKNERIQAVREWARNEVNAVREMRHSKERHACTGVSKRSIASIQVACQLAQSPQRSFSTIALCGLR